MKFARILTIPSAAILLSPVAFGASAQENPLRFRYKSCVIVTAADGSESCDPSSVRGGGVPGGVGGTPSGGGGGDEGPAAPADCNAPWGGTVVSGTSVLAYLLPAPPQNGSCQSVSLSCNDGAFSGPAGHESYQYASCELPEPDSEPEDSEEEVGDTGDIGISRWITDGWWSSDEGEYVNGGNLGDFRVIWTSSGSSPTAQGALAHQCFRIAGGSGNYAIGASSSYSETRAFMPGHDIVPAAQVNSPAPTTHFPNDWGGPWSSPSNGEWPYEASSGAINTQAVNPAFGQEWCARASWILPDEFGDGITMNITVIDADSPNPAAGSSYRAISPGLYFSAQ